MDILEVLRQERKSAKRTVVVTRERELSPDVAAAVAATHAALDNFTADAGFAEALVPVVVRARTEADARKRVRKLSYEGLRRYGVVDGERKRIPGSKGNPARYSNDWQVGTRVKDGIDAPPVVKSSDGWWYVAPWTVIVQQKQD